MSPYFKCQIVYSSSIIVDAAGDGEISPVDGPEESVLGSLDNIFRSVKDFDQVPLLSAQELARGLLASCNFLLSFTISSLYSSLPL